MKSSKGIGVKLYMLIVFVIIFILSMSSFTWVQFKNFDEKSKESLQATIEYINLVDNARQTQVDFKIQVQEWKNTLLRGYDSEAFNKYYSEFSKKNDNIQVEILKLKEDMSRNGMDTSLADTLLQSHKDLYSKYSNAIKSYDKNNPENYRTVDKLVEGIDRKVNDDMDSLVKQIQDKAKLENQNAIDQSYIDTNKFNKTLIYITALGIILIILFSIIIRTTYNDIKRFIEEFNILIKKAEDGDLTIKGKVYKKDELGQITEKFNKFIDSIRGVISGARETSELVASSSNEIMQATDEVSKTSEEVSSTISYISEGAYKQAELAKEGNNSVKGVVEGLNRITENTVHIDELASKAIKTVTDGTMSIKDQSNKMINTKNASENVTEAITNLSIKSKEIGTVVEFINQITEQINLLSLNASIEAARAGEAGRGFTIVANEVKKLAELSKESTQKISTLIMEVQNHIEKAVGEVNNTKVSIDEQADSLKMIDSSFNLIEKSVLGVANKIKEVSNETKEINENAILVEKTIKNIVDIVQQNAVGTEEVASATTEQTASIEEIAASMNQLAELSNNLDKLIAKFKV